ncbi:MAG: dimethylsulfonioproprionate lyase family protein [Paracoccaceae bacterium]|nr:dimethylsulfonioproprionate lyase family protein [Paracoccaceae bacterium]MDG2259240.1 dimethylsulfonioproprionate lyase family protein [Paracoccaceae bacterium]
MTDAFENLLNEAQKLHDANAVLQEFGALPVDPKRQVVEPFYIPAAKLMEADTDLFSDDFSSIRDAIIAASPDALWRETYKGTRIAELFRERFGCYCLIGKGGPYVAEDMAIYIVYMPEGLYYPFHHHPAEELYFILAGEAEFMMKDKPSKVLGPGDHVYHPSMHPHATQTHDHPFLALVLFKGEIGMTPVLTFPEGDE